MPGGPGSECCYCSHLCSVCRNSSLNPIFRPSPTFFHQPHFVWEPDHSSQGPGPKRMSGKCVGIVRDSLDSGRREIDSLSYALPYFPQPCSRIGAVNHASEKAQPFCCIIAVPTDVVLGDLRIQSEKGIHASGLGEDVSRMAKLRGFYGHGFLHVENVFLPKQIDPACPACELAIEERVIIRAPADLGDIKVAGNVQLRTHSLQLRSLDRATFQAQPDLIQSARIPAEAMIGSFGRFHLQEEIGR